ncbi:MAG: hypothetical protein WBQ95_02020, partial [Terracidiphilus sp.]
MRDSSGSQAIQPAAVAPVIAVAAREGIQLVPQTSFLTLIAFGAFFICFIHATVAGANTVPAAGIGYLCLT